MFINWPRRYFVFQIRKYCHISYFMTIICNLFIYLRIGIYLNRYAFAHFHHVIGCEPIATYLSEFHTQAQ